MAIVYDGNGGDRTHHSMVETIPLLTSPMQRLEKRRRTQSRLIQSTTSRAQLSVIPSVFDGRQQNSYCQMIVC